MNIGRNTLTVDATGVTAGTGAARRQSMTSAISAFKSDIRPTKSKADPNSYLVHDPTTRHSSSDVVATVNRFAHYSS